MRIPGFAGFGVSSVERNDRQSDRTESKNLIIEFQKCQKF
ncbi:Uncharacterized protein dnm_006560 [Desulfonema magnum]|uniref:Uncharacterized protein n=1 Tax=Desulfonema magnum TaxID=45655 RepID=A0A975GKI2_9BACT|nr:Uncharacterized protein dnm_006560 [Desulfonema magnum]